MASFLGRIFLLWSCVFVSKSFAQSWLDPVLELSADATDEFFSFSGDTLLIPEGVDASVNRTFPIGKLKFNGVEGTYG